MVRKYWKDYSLSGGLQGDTSLTEQSFEEKVEQEWFIAQVDRMTFKKLIKRSDAPALYHMGIWMALLAISGTGAYFTWGTWWVVPFLAIYGVLYSAADHRHHELSHGTPFKTRWINDMFFHLCAFMTLREGNYYRWSHTRHHTHTLIVGKDPEIAAPRPPFILGIVSDLFFIHDGIVWLLRTARNATGNVTEDGKHFIPENERGKAVWASRAYLAVIAIVVGSCLVWQTVLPLAFVVGPRFYGGFLSQLFNLTQHAAMDEDVYDHRLNTRTVCLNPVFAFLYFNMNFHIEHHMFPMVPYYRLPQVHELIKDECPPTYRGLVEAYSEIIPALLRQRKDPSYYVRRPLPDGALPEQTVAVG